MQRTRPERTLEQGPFLLPKQINSSNYATYNSESYFNEGPVVNKVEVLRNRKKKEQKQSASYLWSTGGSPQVYE